MCADKEIRFNVKCVIGPCDMNKINNAKLRYNFKLHLRRMYNVQRHFQRHVVWSRTFIDVLSDAFASKRYYEESPSYVLFFSYRVGPAQPVEITSGQFSARRNDNLNDNFIPGIIARS